MKHEYGPGDYVPPPVVLYWSFRLMVGAGLLMILISLFALFIDLKKLYRKFPWFLKLLPWAIILPYLANTTGWILTEVGRYPWVVYGLVKMQDGVSKAVTGGMLLTSLIGFILVYGLIITATVFLMMKFAKAGPAVIVEPPAEFTPSVVTPTRIAIGGIRMTLNTLWFIFIAILYTGFFVLEGFDFGVGILLPFLGKTILNAGQLSIPLVLTGMGMKSG